MRWRRRTDESPPPDSEIEPAWSLPVVHASPGLQTLISRVGDRTGLRVLDLGPALAANFRFFQGFSDHVRFVDLPGIGATAAGAEGTSCSFPGDWGAFDLVLAWDAFNYLDRRASGELVASLERLCRAGAGLFSMVFSSEDMSARPMEYRIVDEHQIAYRALTPDRRSSAGLTAAAMERLLGEFEVERSIVLRHGVLELVAVKR